MSQVEYQALQPPSRQLSGDLIERPGNDMSVMRMSGISDVRSYTWIIIDRCMCLCTYICGGVPNMLCMYVHIVCIYIYI